MTNLSTLRVPPTHPHVAVITVDPADHNVVNRLISGWLELKLLHCDDQQPNTWTLYVGAASLRAKTDFEGWADNLK